MHDNYCYENYYFSILRIREYLGFYFLFKKIDFFHKMSPDSKNIYISDVLKNSNTFNMYNNSLRLLRLKILKLNNNISARL